VSNNENKLYKKSYRTKVLKRKLWDIAEFEFLTLSRIKVNIKKGLFTRNQNSMSSIDLCNAQMQVFHCWLLNIEHQSQERRLFLRE